MQSLHGQNHNLSYTCSEYHHYSLVSVHGHHVYVTVRVYVQECLRTQDSPQYSYVYKESSLA